LTNKQKKRKAFFTLAEVLLTLAIIGIIAAMTLPALLNSTNKMENVVALKKAYETLSQITYSIMAENGGSMPAALSSATTPENLANVFIPKLNVAKNCGVASTKATGCFPDITYKFLGGDDWQNIATNTGCSTILTNDNMAYSFNSTSASCTADWSNPTGTTSSPLFNTCGTVSIDINGPNKGPAIMGRDVFTFALTRKGLIPRGAYSENAVDCLTYGQGCTSKVILEGAMNY